MIDSNPQINGKHNLKNKLLRIAKPDVRKFHI